MSNPASEKYKTGDGGWVLSSAWTMRLSPPVQGGPRGVSACLREVPECHTRLGSGHTHEVLNMRPDGLMRPGWRVGRRVS